MRMRGTTWDPVQEPIQRGNNTTDENLLWLELMFYSFIPVYHSVTGQAK